MNADRARPVLLLMLLVAAFAAAADEPAPWYVGGHLGVARADEALGESDAGSALRLTLGRQLSEAITLELEAGGGDFELADGRALEQRQVALNVMLVNRRAHWNPYFLLSVGAFDHEGRLAAGSFADTGVVAQTAIGGLWDLNGFGMMLRADLRYRHADLDQAVIERGQALVTIGLELPIGR